MHSGSADSLEMMYTEPLSVSSAADTSLRLSHITSMLDDMSAALEFLISFCGELIFELWVGLKSDGCVDESN